jgi:hypothetical protein
MSFQRNTIADSAHRHTSRQISLPVKRYTLRPRDWIAVSLSIPSCLLAGLVVELKAIALDYELLGEDLQVAIRAFGELH